MAVTICHASIDENNSAKNGVAGDQTGKEVCTRSWYSKPWSIMLRYADSAIAKKAAAIAVKLANSNLVGYDQNQRNTLYAELKKNNFDVDAYIKSGVKTETDCSAFVYACYCCVIASLRADGNAPTTSTMKTKFIQNGFSAYGDTAYTTSSTKLQVGDVLVKPGSHTVMVSAISSTSTTTTQSTTSNENYYAAYTGNSSSLVDALKAVGVSDTSLTNRKKIAVANGINNYSGTAEQNGQLLTLLKAGKLIMAGTAATAATTSVSNYYPKYTGSSSSIVEGLKAVGVTDTSLTHRKAIATANGISGYTGTAAQNTLMLNLLKQGTLIQA